ncbi:carbohydrate kinase family protein [Alicyclobacillus fastidiosus]|uniref:PfkB family carbohydrate kinase n=1 Tax=Alicyclobacillus fastidiosus TaxID=392011 RepID=A0ABV5AE80_9BACL|nr:PfkB family carbohydrate kinase [Alicyclobacillus fastidiosus]WEH09858.1 PfkB family carbohydrate kinase [Alicyclobacillus fastidiosus]
MSPSSITVFGNIFVDIKGVSTKAIRKNTKNQGSVDIQYGGVARNVATNLGILGSRSRLVAACNEGAIGDTVLARLREAGVDTEHVKRFASGGMGTWLAILDPDGELVASVSEQPVGAHQEDAMLGHLADVLADTAMVALDVCVSRTVNERLIAACKSLRIPVYGVVGNLAALLQHVDSISDLTALVCNQDEASALTQVPDVGPHNGEQVLKLLSGITGGSGIVTLAERGCLIYQHDVPAYTHLTVPRAVVLDSTGAGDAFFAGLLHGLASGDSFTEAAKTASSVAAQVVGMTGNTL